MNYKLDKYVSKYLHAKDIDNTILYLSRMHKYMQQGGTNKHAYYILNRTNKFLGEYVGVDSDESRRYDPDSSYFNTKLFALYELIKSDGDAGSGEKVGGASVGKRLSSLQKYGSRAHKTFKEHRKRAREIHAKGKNYSKRVKKVYHEVKKYNRNSPNNDSRKYRKNSSKRSKNRLIVGNDPQKAFSDRMGNIRETVRKHTGVDLKKLQTQLTESQRIKNHIEHIDDQINKLENDRNHLTKQLTILNTQN